MEQFIELVHEYIRWYNEKRIKLSLGGLSPASIVVYTDFGRHVYLIDPSAEQGINAAEEAIVQ